MGRLIILFCLVTNLAFAQTDSVRNKKVIWVSAGAAGIYTASLIGLSVLWYSEQEQTSFHFFNDQHQWQFMDKMGHSYTTFQLSHVGINAFKWAGLPSKKAYILGGITGFLMMTPIEIMDGFSSQYGASWADILANAAGSALVISQFLLWDEIRIHFKFSYHPTSFADLRPNVLGKQWAQRIVKDYNGQTYWLSFDIYKCLPPKNQFPKWLNFSIGYAAEGMVYATHSDNIAAGYRPYKRLLVGLDIDLTHIKSKHKFIRSFLHLVNLIRLPAPALEMNSKGELRVHGLYF